MDKIKEINEFNNILDYYKYLEETLKDLNQKADTTTSSKLKEFYTEQLDIAMKKRNSIRSVVLAKKNKILHDKLSNIKDKQINDFIKNKKKEKQDLAKQKLDLELEIPFYRSINELNQNFMAPMAKDASSYDCSDFYISDEAFNKLYLFKDEDGNLCEYTGLMVLSKYLKGNFNILNKIYKRHELKEKFLNKYIDEIKQHYPDYSKEKVYSLASDNLISHSPEFLEVLEKDYAFNSNEYKALSEAYSDFDDDYKYISKIDIASKQKELDSIENQLSCLSCISDNDNLENYILQEFENKQSKAKLLKTATEILESDNNITKYINKNNLLKDIELSPETRLTYSEQLEKQNNLLRSIQYAEDNIVKNENTIEKSEKFLHKLKNSQKVINDIGMSDNAIKEISRIVEDYNSKFLIPLEEAKNEYEDFKNSQELSLIPYQKVGFFQKIAGFFNGRNKIQAEFDNKCREFEANINVLSHKAALNRPDYSFTNSNEFHKNIGQSIKDSLFKNPEHNEYSVCKKVLNSYVTDLNSHIYAFKNANIDSINELENCYSYNDIAKCISIKIDDVQTKLADEKSKQTNLAINKSILCNAYNEFSAMPISPASSITQISNTRNEFKKQLKKIYDYKGESHDTLKYKIQVEKMIENDDSFLSDTEKLDLDNSAYKTAENIIHDAVNNYIGQNSIEQFNNDGNLKISL